MANTDFPTLNGIAPSWADIATSFAIDDGALIDSSDYKEINWSDSLTIGVQRGPGGRKRRRTTGELDCEASAVFYRDGLLQLASKLADKAPRRAGDVYQIGLVGFNITILHTPPGRDGIFRVELLGVRIAGRDYKAAEGSDADVVSVPLNIMDLWEYDEQGRRLALI